MLFKMPGIYDLEIVCSDPEKEGEIDEEVAGVTYHLIWGDHGQPIIYATRQEAYCAAMAAQWAAHRMLEISFKKQGNEK